MKINFCWLSSQGSQLPKGRMEILIVFLQATEPQSGFSHLNIFKFTNVLVLLTFNKKCIDFLFVFVLLYSVLHSKPISWFYFALGCYQTGYIFADMANVIETLSAKSPSDCQLKCREITACQGWSFDIPERICGLLSNATFHAAQVSIVSGTKFC